MGSLTMDAVRSANLQAYVAFAPKDNVSTTYEKKQLLEAKRKRSTMSIMQRMEADTEHKQALEQVLDMRQTAETRQALDKMVERMRPAPELRNRKSLATTVRLFLR